MLYHQYPNTKEHKHEQAAVSKTWDTSQCHANASWNMRQTGGGATFRSDIGSQGKLVCVASDFEHAHVHVCTCAVHAAREVLCESDEVMTYAYSYIERDMSTIFKTQKVPVRMASRKGPIKKRRKSQNQNVPQPKLLPAAPSALEGELAVSRALGDLLLKSSGNCLAGMRFPEFRISWV